MIRRATDLVQHTNSVATLACGLVGYLLAAIPVVASADVAPPLHRAMVERAGQAIMPFNLHHAMHIFKPLPDGGVQTVTVLNADPKQIALVRLHLRKEAAAFASGNYSDPATIHGMSMPGLAQLRAGAHRLAVSYVKRVDGASIRYQTSDQQLISALHQWFAAQVEDHGAHAMMAH